MSILPWREFSAVSVESRARVWLGAVLTVVVAAAGLLGAGIVLLPRSITYGVAPGSLVITAQTGILSSTKRLALADIREARTVHLAGGRRVAGSSLPGYCSGHFRYPGLGDVWQATDCRPDVLLLDLGPAQRPVLVSPAEPDRFRAALAHGTPERFVPPAIPAPRWWWAVQVLAGAPLALVAVVPLLFFVAPRRLGYAVGPGFLEVRTWLRRRRFDVTGATVRQVSPGRCMRIVGSAMPGYYAGRFRIDGGVTRVYASTLKDGVLVEGGERVFVSPADGTAFVAALRDAGARLS